MSLKDLITVSATVCDTCCHWGLVGETDGCAVWQERVNAPAICDRSVSLCHLSETSNMLRQTYEVIHRERNSGTLEQTLSDSRDITLVITAFSLPVGALTDWHCGEMQVNYWNWEATVYVTRGSQRWFHLGCVKAKLSDQEGCSKKLNIKPSIGTN